MPQPVQRGVAGDRERQRPHRAYSYALGLGRREQPGIGFLQELVDVRAIARIAKEESPQQPLGLEGFQDVAVTGGGQWISPAEKRPYRRWLATIATLPVRRLNRG